MQISIHRGHSATRRIQERHLQLGTVPSVRSEPCLPREPLPRQHSERFVHPHRPREHTETGARHLRLTHVRFRVPAGPGGRRHATDRPTGRGSPALIAVPERTVRDDVQTQQFVKRLRSVTVERVSGHIILHQRDPIENSEDATNDRTLSIRSVVHRVPSIVGAFCQFLRLDLCEIDFTGHHHVTIINTRGQGCSTAIACPHGYAHRDRNSAVVSQRDCEAQ